MRTMLGGTRAWVSVGESGDHDMRLEPMNPIATAQLTKSRRRCRGRIANHLPQPVWNPPDGRLAQGGTARSRGDRRRSRGGVQVRPPTQGAPAGADEGCMADEELYPDRCFACWRTVEPHEVWRNADLNGHDV